MADYNDVWVYIEHKNGTATPMSFELLGVAQTLAGRARIEGVRLRHRRER